MLHRPLPSNAPMQLHPLQEHTHLGASTSCPDQAHASSPFMSSARPISACPITLILRPAPPSAPSLPAAGAVVPAGTSARCGQTGRSRLPGRPWVMGCCSPQALHHCPRLACCMCAHTLLHPYSSPPAAHRLRHPITHILPGRLGLRVHPLQAGAQHPLQPPLQLHHHSRSLPDLSGPQGLKSPHARALPEELQGGPDASGQGVLPRTSSGAFLALCADGGVLQLGVLDARGLEPHLHRQQRLQQLRVDSVALQGLGAVGGLRTHADSWMLHVPPGFSVARENVEEDAEAGGEEEGGAGAHLQARPRVGAGGSNASGTGGRGPEEPHSLCNCVDLEFLDACEEAAKG